MYGTNGMDHADSLSGTRICFEGKESPNQGKRLSAERPRLLTLLDEDVVRKKLDYLATTKALSAFTYDGCCGCKNCCYILRYSKRALMQILLAVVFISGWIAFGIVQGIKAYNSENAWHHPQKISSQKTYFKNDRLQYLNPYFYFWFEIDVFSDNFTDSYICSYNSTAACLREYFYSLLTFEDNIEYWYNQSSQDSQKSGTERRRYASLTDVLNPWCEMEMYNTTSEQSFTRTGLLKDYQIYVDRVGYYEEDLGSTYDYEYDKYAEKKMVSHPFGVLIQLQIDDIPAARGRYTCDSSLDVQSIHEDLRYFTEWFNLWMFMSRDNITHAVGIEDLAPQMRSIFSTEEEIYGADMRFFYEERVFCNLEDVCSSEFYVESTAMTVYQDRIKITINPLPKVTYYQEFVQYTYLDCMSSIGGLWTIILGLYIAVSTFVVNCNNTRDKDDIKCLGILPLLSKTAENEEEIAYLRKIVMTLLDLNRKHFFRSLNSPKRGEGYPIESTKDFPGGEIEIQRSGGRIEGKFDNVYIERGGLEP